MDHENAVLNALDLAREVMALDDSGRLTLLAHLCGAAPAAVRHGLDYLAAGAAL